MQVLDYVSNKKTSGFVNRRNKKSCLKGVYFLKSHLKFSLVLLDTQKEKLNSVN